MQSQSIPFQMVGHKEYKKFVIHIKQEHDWKNYLMEYLNNGYCLYFTPLTDIDANCILQ